MTFNDMLYSGTGLADENEKRRESWSGIGRNTCENLVKHTKNKSITLINRTKDKAERVAGKFDLIVKDHADLQSEIRKTDILIVATGAQRPTISKELIHAEQIDPC